MRGVPRLSVPLSHAFALPRRMRQFTEVPYAIEYALLAVCLWWICLQGVALVGDGCAVGALKAYRMLLMRC